MIAFVPFARFGAGPECGAVATGPDKASTGSGLTGSALIGAVLTDAVLTGAALTGSALIGAALTGSAPKRPGAVRTLQPDQD